MHRVWIDPDYLDEVISAVQKDDVRRLIEDGVIKARPIKGTSRSRARKGRATEGEGKEKGTWFQKGELQCQSPEEGEMDEANQITEEGAQGIPGGRDFN